jgi:hypothetical protein
VRRGILVGLTLAVLAAAPAQAARLRVSVLSDHPELISGGDALVAVSVPHGVRHVRVHAGRRDVTRRFTRRGTRLIGLVSRLKVGRTVLRATAPGARTGRVTIVDHPRGGPVFSGPQLKPWVCQSGARDAKCNQPTTYAFTYQDQAGLMHPYDPGNPPGDVATTTTDQGRTVPFIVRTETGYMDRDQYAISVLYDPHRRWTATAPQRQFNHKLLITHGASCGIDHQAGTAPSTTSDTVGVPGAPANPSGSPTVALGRGFAVMSTALDNAGHNCNLVTEAESLVMAKEHLIERYGTLRYTIGTGCSGGSLAQQQIANAYPGVYQGILPQCSFPDAWSTGNQLADYHLTRLYFEHPSEWGLGVLWTPVQEAAVQGHPNYVNSIILDSLYFTALGDPTNACAGVTDSERWSPSNPKGVRCTLADDQVNIFGRRPDGYAGRPLDNVGIQYGLDAVRKGLITVDQFVDLNVKIGGADINAQPQAARVVADEPALRNANRSGAIDDGSNLDQVAIIDLRGSDDGSFHDAYRAFATRARLDREHGTHANQVIWEGPAPLIGGTDFTTRGLLAMDRWLSAVEKDKRHVGVARKIRQDKPADIADHCELAGGAGSMPGTDCPAIVRVYSTPRMVAGDSIATDTNKCRLKPLTADDDGVLLTPVQLAALRTAFPTGVCDFSKPAVDSETPTLPWMQYAKVGGRPLPGRRVAAGWAGPAFRSVRGPAAARAAARAALARR